ncbi:hypothetical protein H6P81_009908 [Aristolochia fimbriata]|uniref:Uncharacterized protein n=1 Tax=Aristolochia fimbriata TaxID=158543 RepID=A0AAV7ERP9_ARIFI|nr:hypothetical protein H6P81_009908 [Aristolochia fimbriata]
MAGTGVTERGKRLLFGPCKTMEVMQERPSAQTLQSCRKWQTATTREKESLEFLAHAMVLVSSSWTIERHSNQKPGHDPSSALSKLKLATDTVDFGSSFVYLGSLKLPQRGDLISDGAPALLWPGSFSGLTVQHSAGNGNRTPATLTAVVVCSAMPVGSGRLCGPSQLGHVVPTEVGCLGWVNSVRQL